jgi:hypothetical protein
MAPKVTGFLPGAYTTVRTRIQELPCCHNVQKCITAIMEAYDLIQFRVSSVLFIYPHPADLKFFIIIQFISLAHTWSLKGIVSKIVPVHVIKIWGSSWISVLDGGTSRQLYRRAKRSWDALSPRLVGPENWCGRFGEEKYLLPLREIEPRIVQSKVTDKKRHWADKFWVDI